MTTPDTTPTPKSKLAASRSIRKLLRESEVAEIYGLSVKTLQGWRHLHIGPPYKKISRCVRYCPDELDAFFAAKTVQTQG